MRRDGIYLRSGPFLFHIQSKLTDVAKSLHILYADHRVENDSEFADFHVGVDRVRGVRRYFFPEVTFYSDNSRPFFPTPSDSAAALLEWGLNWCISNFAHQYGLVHSAVLARDNNAMILPAPPESGKSTLCAAMACSGWRLLSDELALISPNSLDISPMVRPVGLKNNSIDIIRSRYPDQVIGPLSPRTPKGIVAHMRPPADSVEKADQTATPRWIVFPKFDPNAILSIEEKPKSRALMELARNTNNFHHLGEAAFGMLTKVVDQSACYDIKFSSVDDALSAVAQIADG